MTAPRQPLEHFLSDGQQRLLQDPTVRAQLQAAVAEIEEKHRDLMRNAGWLRRLMLRWRMRTAIREAFERVAPTDALYLTSH